MHVYYTRLLKVRGENIVIRSVCLSVLITENYTLDQGHNLTQDGGSMAQSFSNMHGLDMYQESRRFCELFAVSVCITQKLFY